MKKHLKKLLLVVGLVAYTAAAFAATWTWGCNGNVYTLSMDSEQISIEDQEAIAIAVRDMVCQ